MTYSDPIKQREYNKEWRRKRRIEEKNMAYEILGGKCVMCGNSDYRVLQIDHIKAIRRRKERIDKTGTRIKQMIANGSMKIDNLQLLCANCHQIKTYDELWACKV